MHHGLAATKKRLADGAIRWYVYAWRGGPCIHVHDGPTHPAIDTAMLDAAAEARRLARAAPDNTIAGLILAYRQSPEYVGRAASTLRDYDRWLDRIADRFGPTPLDVFDDRRIRRKIMEWRDQWQDQPRTADKASVILAILLGWGVERGILSINAAAGIPTLYRSDRAEIIWTDSDWAAILPHCSDQLADALRMASMSGLRLGDLVALDWAHVGDQAVILTTAKRKRRVVIPILPELRQLLDRLMPAGATQRPATGPVLRNSRGKRWTTSGLGGLFQRARLRANGIDPDARPGKDDPPPPEPVTTVRIHDLRGTYATWLAKKGLTDQEIARIVGWSETQVAEIRRRYIDEAHVVTSIVNRLTRAG